MSWQQNVVLQRPVGGPEGREEKPFTAPNGNSGDSSILRYIKTLTSHQTNAKQQRMDRYLRQVKHPQPADKRVAIGPKPLPTTGNKHQPVAKSLVSQLQKNSLPKVLQHEPKARSDRGKAAGRKSKGHPRAKRQYEGAQSHRQRKKVKETPTSQQNTGIGSLDRFRLNGTWSQDKTQTTVTAKRDEISETRPATVRSAECMKGPLPAQGSPTRAQVSTGIPGTMKSRFWPSVATPGQCFGPVRSRGFCSRSMEANDSNVFCE